MSYVILGLLNNQKGIILFIPRLAEGKVKPNLNSSVLRHNLIIWIDEHQCHKNKTVRRNSKTGEKDVMWLNYLCLSELPTCINSSSSYLGYQQNLIAPMWCIARLETRPMCSWRKRLSQSKPFLLALGTQPSIYYTLCTSISDTGNRQRIDLKNVNSKVNQKHK